MSGEMIYAMIFMICFVLLAALVMYLSKTIDHGEARFDTTNQRESDPDEK